MTTKRWIAGRWAVLAAMLAAAPTVWAEGIDDFTLTRVIPADVFIAAHSRSHAGQEFLNAQYARVWDALEKSGIDKDIKKLVMSMAAKQEGGEEQAEALWTQMSELLAGVEWSTLMERESAFAMRMTTFPVPDVVILFMPPADKAAGDFAGLAAILKTFAEMAPADIALTEDDSADTQIRSVSPKQAPFPIALTVARHKDVLMISLGGSMGEQVLSMLKEPGGDTLAKTERFTNAFKGLPAPTDGFSFFDFARFWVQLRKFIDDAMQMAPTPAPDSPNYEQQMAAMKLPGKFIEALDMFEYSAEVSTTLDKRTTTDSITVLRDDAAGKPLHKVLFGNGALKDPLKYIPATAGSFGVSSGLDFLALYRESLRFIKDEIPDGSEMLAEWDKVQTENGISVENDVFGWIQGGFTAFDVPGPREFSSGDFVVMLSVRDEAKAREMIDKLMAMVEPLLKQQQGSIEDAAIEGTTGFKSILWPMLSFVQLSRPTIGVHDGQLMFGSSAKVLEHTMQVAAGKADNFAKNARFLKEGLSPGANVTNLSFTDTSTTGEELSQMLKMVPMLGMIPDFQKIPELGAVLRMVNKLAPVFEKLDFFLSECSQTTMDGNVLKTQTITNYQQPPAPAGSTGESAGDGR